MNGRCTMAWDGTDLHTIINRFPYREKCKRYNAEHVLCERADDHERQGCIGFNEFKNSDGKLSYMVRLRYLK